MMKPIFYCLLLLMTAAACTNHHETTLSYETVPLLREIALQPEKEGFQLNRKTKIQYASASDLDVIETTANLLADYVHEATGYRPEVISGIAQPNTILLMAGYSHENPEAYSLSVHKSNIIISGASHQGVARAVQTIRRLLPMEPTETITFPAVDILDYPAFPHRGASLDVARHFFPVEFVKKYIDVLALFNMNVFHWHLTDDQGWRIELENYPELTRKGSMRDRTIMGRHTTEYTETPHGGFYTKEEIVEVVKYAMQRQITVIPEIDIPGHTLAVLASYPELGCTGGPYEVATGWGIHEDVLCVGNEKVFTFLNDVLEEVCPLFPGPYIHIGGDECLKNRWMACSKCQARVRELGLKAIPEHTVGEQLQSYFIRRVEEMVHKRKKRIIGWDEILEGGIASDATIMSWRGTEGGIIAANQGHDVIMTPEAYLYLDYYQTPDVDNEPFTYGWLTELEKTFSFDPIPAGLDADKKKHILGAQANIWTEYIPTGEHVEYMLLPRMCALAETLWNYPDKKDYSDFVRRMRTVSERLDQMGYQNCKWAYEEHPEKPKVQHKALGKPAVLAGKPGALSEKPAALYAFQGASTLVDGYLGARSSYRTGTWIGFWGEDMEITIDLEMETPVSSVSLNAYNNPRGGVYPPKRILVSLSDDGNSFREVASMNCELPSEEAIEPVAYELKLPQADKARFVRVKAESYKTYPAGHMKAGEKVYLMTDEVCVR